MNIFSGGISFSFGGSMCASLPSPYCCDFVLLMIIEEPLVVIGHVFENNMWELCLYYSHVGDMSGFESMCIVAFIIVSHLPSLYASMCAPIHTSPMYYSSFSVVYTFSLFFIPFSFSLPLKLLVPKVRTSCTLSVGGEDLLL